MTTTHEVFVEAIVLLDREVCSYYTGPWTRWNEAAAVQWKYEMRPVDAFALAVSDVALFHPPQMLLTKERTRNAGTTPIVVTPPLFMPGVDISLQSICRHRNVSTSLEVVLRSWGFSQIRLERRGHRTPCLLVPNHVMPLFCSRTWNQVVLRVAWFMDVLWQANFPLPPTEWLDDRKQKPHVFVENDVEQAQLLPVHCRESCRTG